MITKLKQPCWIATCDNCGGDVFGYDYNQHFATKKELLEMIESEDVERLGDRQFCSLNCEIEWGDKNK